jgi:hypothetical protein
MLSLMVAIIVILFGIGIFLLCKDKLAIAVCIMLLSIPVVCIMIPQIVPSEQNYPLQTSVLLTGDVRWTAIYFQEFTQEGNKVTINNYATVNYPWTDFNFARLNEHPITITLSDNEGNFIYTDRRIGITHNKNIGAIQ